MTSPTPLAPFSVPALIVTSLDALTSAAALHLGEPGPDGRSLAAPDPQEAWGALAAAYGLLAHAGPLLSDETIEPFQAAHAYLMKKLAERHPDVEFPVSAAFALPYVAAQPAAAAPRAGMPDVKSLAEAGLEALDAPAAPRASSTGPLPRRPGTGLPTKGSSPLFPR